MGTEIRYTTTSDGVGIAYCVAGRGPALLVLPNLPISHLQAEWQLAGYRSFIERIGERRTVIRFDARGLGLSDRECADFSLEAHLLDIRAVLDKARIAKCSVFAASYAGPLGIAFAARYPERVERLVLWCTHSSFADVIAEVSPAQMQQRDAIIGLARVDPSLGVHTYIHHATGWGSDEDTAGVTLAAIKTVEVTNFFPQLARYAEFDATDCLASVQAPTLVLHRSGFRGSHVNVARRLAVRLPDARLLLLEGESVVPFAGDSEAGIRAITDFLRPNEAGGLREAPVADQVADEVVSPARRAEDTMQALLFSDIEGHTTFMQRLGDDRGRELLREHEDMTRRALQAHGGREIKTLGDGFIAAFPSVRGALECAIDLQRRLATANRDAGSAIGTASLSGHPVKIRIGINAGEPLSEEHDLFGTSVIAVARIAAEAAGGEIVVADVVRQLAAGKQFAFRDRGEVLLRGFEEPVRLHLLRWETVDARPQPSTADVSAIQRVTGKKLEADSIQPSANDLGLLVGRSGELSTLTDAVMATARGSGGVILVCGEVGTGKTRLLEEAATIATAQGAAVAWGRCDPGSFAPPLWPWIQVLREVERLLPQREIETDANTRSTIARMLGEQGESDASLVLDGSDQGRFRLFDATERHLERVAESRPLVVILDDLHSADVMSLGLLEFVAARARHERLLLLVAVSDSEVPRGAAIERSIGQLMRLPGALRIDLRPLGESEVGELLGSVMQSKPVPKLVARIARETGGNPFFAIEIARLLDRSEGGSDEGIQRVPAGVREVVLQRCSGLPDRPRRLLEYGAVSGSEFDLATLERVPQLAAEPGTLLEAIEPAEALRIVEPVPATGGTYRFAQSLVRDVIYEGIPAAARARMHLAVGTALEAGPGSGRFDHLSRVANHLMNGIAAGDARHACEASKRAGDAAFGVFAYDRAVHHYAEALRAHDRAGGSDGTRCQLLVSLGEANIRFGNVRDGKARYREAAEVARADRDAEMFARAALGYGEFVEAGVRDPMRTRLIEEALSLLPNVDHPLRARLLGLLGESLARSGSRQKRLEVSEAGVEMARRLDDPLTLAFTLNTRLWSLWETGDFDQRRRAAAEMLSLATMAGDDTLALKARRWAIVNALESGDPAAADAEVAAYEDLALRLREAVHLWRSATMRIGLAVMRADWTGAEEAMRVAVTRGEAVQSRGIARFFGMQRFMIERCQGRLPALEGELEATVSRVPGLPDMRVLLAIACLAAGKSELARAHYEGIWTEIVSRPVERLGLAGACLLAELCANLGDTGRADLIESNLKPQADRNAIFGDTALVLGPAVRFLGLLSLQQGQLAEAALRFESALDRARQLRAPYLVAEVQIDLAGCLVRSGKDPHRVTILLDEASAIAEQHGLVDLSERIAGLRTRVAAEPATRRPVQPDRLPAGLTAREAEVLRLLALGRSSKETAEELVLSVRTVERHVANIYTKIDAHSRAEATTFAIRIGLV